MATLASLARMVGKKMGVPEVKVKWKKRFEDIKK
jgi:hypothetical protein